jgi:hypothetical protein
MIRKSGSRFSEQIMLKQKCMIRKSGSRFSEQIMLQQKCRQTKHEGEDIRQWQSE